MQKLPQCRVWVVVLTTATFAAAALLLHTARVPPSGRQIHDSLTSFRGLSTYRAPTIAAGKPQRDAAEAALTAAGTARNSTALAVALTQQAAAGVSVGLGIRPLPSRDCPTWFKEYATFHAQRRGKAGTTYLVHLVNGTSGGLGDRLNGALSMLRLARALNRVLLLHWAMPFDIESFFEPAGKVNWSTQGIPYDQTLSSGPVFSFVDDAGWNQPELHDGSLDRVADTFLVVITNLPINGSCWKCPPLASAWSVESACVWQHMFRPVGDILRQAESELARMYPTDTRGYVAVHLRLGGLTGEEGIPGSERGGLSPLHDFLAGATCAARLAASSSISLRDAPVLVVTDNHDLRQALQQGALPTVVTPAGLPVHLDQAQGQSLAAHRSTIVDLVLLSSGTCLVTSVSGFSLHAWLYGGAKPCTAALTSCL